MNVLPPPGKVCIRQGCSLPGVTAFMSDPDEPRCEQHHDEELGRRIAALEAAKGVFISLVGGSSARRKTK